MDMLLHNEDILKCVLSFASASDLQNLDLVSTNFRRLTSEVWKARTFQEFGFKTGKAGWIKGTSLLKPPTVFLMNPGHFGQDIFYDGCQNSASNGSMVVSVSEITSMEGPSQDGNTGPSIIGIRDAKSLTFSKAASSMISNWNVAICGRIGSEIIVTSNSMQLCACRGNDYQQWNIHQLDPAIVGPAYPNGVEMIGCETHLIFTLCGKLYLFKVENTSVIPPLLSPQPQQTVCFQEDYNYNFTTQSSPICWAEDNSYFAFFSAQAKKICIFGLDASVGTVSPIQTIDIKDINVYGSYGMDPKIAVTDSFVALSTCEKKIDVWDRQSGTRLHSALCDVDASEELEEEDYEVISKKIPFVTMGHLLIAASHLGCALCIWNLKTGRLLKRHNDASEQRICDELPDGMDVTSMVYVEYLNAFISMMNTEVAWIFPLNENMKRAARLIARREALFLFNM